MRKLLLGLGSVGVGLVAIVLLSSRNLGELLGYVRASADQTVEGLEERIPDAVRDQKLKNDLDQARGDIIDRRVKLNLAASEIRRLQDEIETLAGAADRRQTILAEAYPALQTAANDRLTEVSFAGTKWLPAELGAEIDRLLTEQDRDERQLVIRREALTRLVKSVEDGTGALSEMESKLLEAEHEFNTLVVRREQAQNESELLDLVAAAGRTGATSAAQIGGNLEGLRGDVEGLEARNEARRETVPAGEGDRSRLTQAWDRLERLKSLHEKHQATHGTTTTQVAPKTSAPAVAQEPGKSEKDVIIVIKDAAVQGTETTNTTTPEPTTSGEGAE